MTPYRTLAALLLALAAASGCASTGEPQEAAAAAGGAPNTAVDGARAAGARAAADLRTTPERTDYRETTSYEDVVRIMEHVAAVSPVIHLDTFGYSMEGRALPLAVVGRVADGRPETVRATGRVVVYLQGNIHAGEVEGKESLLILLREIAQGRHTQLLDSLVLLVAPIYNADGNERVRLTNRPAQHGPIGGMGQRPNAQDLDLNRDHMKLESPEARSLARLLNRYDPHLGVDLHTTNGTRHAYHLTYSPPLHPDTPEGITALLRGEWLPAVTQAIRSAHGWEYYYYGNVQGQGDARGWYTFDYRGRFNNNYLGLRNRLAILSEAYSYATFPDRILATSRFIEEILRFAHARASSVRHTVEQAAGEPVIGRRLTLRATHARSAAPVEILMGDVAEERHPFTGAVMLRRLDVRRPERMHEYGTFRTVEDERAPAAYLLLEPTAPVLANLDGHGIRWQRLGTERRVAAETFRVDSSTVAVREWQGRRERTVHGAWVPGRVTAGPQAVVVPMDQPLGRLVFALLEPRSDDGLVNWNFFDRGLEAGQGLPLARVHEPDLQVRQ
jgi:hypothetical protein